MSSNKQNDRRHRLKIRFLFGFFEADATGTIGITAALAFMALAGVGRWWALW